MKKTYLYAIVVILIIAIVLVGLSYFSPIGNMICGRCGCFVYQCDKPPSSWGFSMTLSPTTGIATPGTPFSQTVQITITTTSGTPQPVSFSYTLSQIGLIVTQAAPCTPSSTSPYHCTSTFTVSTGAATSSGTYQVTVIGTSPGASRVSAAYNLTVMFSDGFENGWDPWKGYQVTFGPHDGPAGTSGTTWAIESSVVHSGSYAAEFTLPAETGAWANVYETLDNYYPTLYMSSWSRFDAQIPVESYLLIGPCPCGYNDHDLVVGYIVNSGGVLKWVMEYYTNAKGNVWYISDLGPPINRNVWYGIQVMVTTGNGDGEVAMWVKQDGGQYIQIGDVKGLINDGDKGPSGQIGTHNLQVGPFMPETWRMSTQQPFSVTSWHDDTISSTTFINS